MSTERLRFRWTVAVVLAVLADAVLWLAAG